VDALKREFVELFRASGWKMAEVARRLHMTRGGIGGIVTGRTVPSPSTVKLFKLVLATEKPDALTLTPRTDAVREDGPPYSTESEILLRSIERLRSTDPTAWEAARVVIDRLGREAPPKPNQKSCH